MGLQKVRKERIPQYDLMRAFAMFLVVYVHSSFLFTFTPQGDSKQAGLYWFTSILALSCNALFFMVSGKFNLAQAIKLEASGYRSFYIKKVIDLLLPVVFYAITFWILRFVGTKFFGAWDDGISFWDFGAFFSTVNELLISSWWFVPTIFALMIFTPFIGRMLGNLKQKEAYILVMILFGCAAIIAVEKLIGQTTVLSKFLAPALGTWAGVYILGYVIDNTHFTNKGLIRWYSAAGVLVALLGIAFIVAPQVFLMQTEGMKPVWNNLLSTAFYPVVVGAVYLFFKNINITSSKVKQTIEFIGNRAFGIYLIHFCFYFSFLQTLPNWLREADDIVSGLSKRIVITTIVYIASIAVATLVDLFVVNPIQKRLKDGLLKGYTKN